MLIFPAIDLMGGKVVRLLKGDYSKVTVYSDDPASVAADFENQGATCLHMVDLDGAANGETVNFNTIRSITDTTSLFTEVGGGIRSLNTIDNYLEAGVKRVILGTAAVTNEEFLFDAVRAFGTKVAVGVDIKDGFVATHGWTKTSGLRFEDFCLRIQDIGVRTIICTDISRDGAMQGTNLELYKNLNEKLVMNIIASGGVSSLDDVRRLKEMKMYGAIIGKAYYTGVVSIREAVEVAR